MIDKETIRKAKKIYKKMGRSKMLVFLTGKYGDFRGLRIAKEILAGVL